MQERTGTHAGERAGTRVRGAFETLHGIGENIRGNALSAVDAAAGDGPNHNDEIARRGKQEAQMGVQDMNAQPAPSHHTTGMMGSVAPGPTSTTEPHHHRDDAISGLPNSQTRELQGEYARQEHNLTHAGY